MASASSPKPPRAAGEIFGEHLPLAVRYAELLVTTGIEHGLLGPREASKVWERHIVNCAAVESLLPHRSRLIDIGSGAGLPGLALAIARPDLKVTLVEPMARRTRWLEDALSELGLTQVSVQRARAEEMSALIQAPVVTARAVARLDKLATLAWPLLPEGGRLLALKGDSAETEMHEASAILERIGTSSSTVHEVGADILATPVRVIELVKGSRPRVMRSGSGRGEKT
ncbi:MAG TPA: 16S rRNA (guanine(527)-N(7))-methyltransferase RsmG [Ornithinimicrobium sp.]|uniref:16S rRNA (guanine(527)-N(7))-methyltransferase RsmG n=1 Tax=Ornithinimicrobium sp. TaxID=1977084 RepID=UPI002B484E27|nr:16S rRNA (guanine(527)-N(7))-methyltransferase RsmG [Ornithinimicrobium sp.]HKJ12961.1 16S rRNA (guanine(527)-N(7))-methyltransferase RsmG [Ornithinimicrobium sp.]